MLILLSVACGLVSMTAFALSNALSKPLAQKYGASQVLFLRGLTTVALLGLASIPSFYYLQNVAAVAGTLVLGMVGYLPVLSFTHALKESRLGIVAPIAGTSPLITLLLSFIFLNVALHPVQWLAIIIIVIANIAVSVDLKNWRQSNIFVLKSGVPYALGAAVGWGLFFFFIVYSVRALGPWVAAWVAEIGVMIAAGFHVARTGKVQLRTALQPSIVLNGLLICIAVMAFTLGARYYNIGIVAALSNSTALVATILGYYLFKERLHLKEKVAVVIMIAGVATISIV